MNKNYLQPQISVIHVDNADIICTSAPKNGRGKKAYPPYDRLTDEQQLAFYFLLEYEQLGFLLSSNPQLRLLRFNGLGFDQISYADGGN